MSKQQQLSLAVRRTEILSLSMRSVSFFFGGGGGGGGIDMLQVN